MTVWTTQLRLLGNGVVPAQAYYAAYASLFETVGVAA